jgi:hypothetical protein
MARNGIAEHRPIKHSVFRSDTFIINMTSWPRFPGAMFTPINHYFC